MILYELKNRRVIECKEHNVSFTNKDEYRYYTWREGCSSLNELVPFLTEALSLGLYGDIKIPFL